MLTTEKKRTFKMFVAWLVVLSLMLPATMVPAFATDTDPNVPSENRAKIGMAYSLLNHFVFLFLLVLFAHFLNYLFRKF